MACDDSATCAPSSRRMTRGVFRNWAWKVPRGLRRLEIEEVPRARTAARMARQKRMRAALPKQTETLQKTGRELVKEAKGRGTVSDIAAMAWPTA